MESYHIIVLVFGVLSLLMVGMLYFINRIFQYNNRIKNSYLSIANILEDRGIILEDMIIFVKNNLEHEMSYLKKLENIKLLFKELDNIVEMINKIKIIEKEMFGFVNLKNVYEKLNKNQEFLKIWDRLEKNQDKLIYAFDSYDKGVINYNNYRNNKFIDWLCKLIKMPEYDCYNK